MLLHCDCDGDRRRDCYLFLFLDDVAGVMWFWVARLRWTGLMWKCLLERGQGLDEHTLKRVTVSIPKRPGVPRIPVATRQDLAAPDADRHWQGSQALNESLLQRCFSALTCHAFLLC